MRRIGPTVHPTSKRRRRPRLKENRPVDFFGNSKSIYIDQKDHIHPSPTGVLFISKEIADFLVSNNLFGRGGGN